MKIKTADLVGAALNWAVRQAKNPGFSDYVAARDNFSTCWAKGGHVIDEADIDVFREGDAGFRARLGRAQVGKDGGAKAYFGQLGGTRLIAGMRCFVAFKLGEEVDVPDYVCRLAGLQAGQTTVQ